MFNRNWGTRALALAAIAATATCFAPATDVRAATVVNDTWLDGTDTDTEAGADTDGDGNIESAWFQGGDGTLDPVGLGGPLRGAFSGPGITSSASWTTHFTPEASPVTLAQGDKLRVTWVFTPTNVNATNGSQNFRLALVDSPEGARLSDNGAPGTAAYTGYGMFMNMGQTLGHSSSFQLRERAVASGSFLSGSADWTGLANGATNGNAGYASGTEYTFVMELERTLADALQVDVSMSGGTLDNDGVASVSFLDATPNGFTYDTFGVRPSGATTTAEIFDTKRFQVDYIAVPEPSSLALLGLGGLAALRRRARPRD